ncbi:hypothetical protein JCM16138_02080 [Thermococcus atlanticus]
MRRYGEEVNFNSQQRYEDARYLFDDPEKEAVCEEVGEGIILKKDENGRVIRIGVLLLFA